MMVESRGLILRETSVGDNDKYITILTDNYGKISVYTNGTRSFKRGRINVVQPLCYNELSFYKKNDSYRMHDAVLVEEFQDVRNDIEAYTLALYMLDVLCDVALESDDQEPILKLALNTLYMMTVRERSLAFIKAVFELRLMSIIGYMPALEACDICAADESENIFFDTINGVFICDKCRKKLENDELSDISNSLDSITLPVLTAMRHTIYSNPKRIFAFKLNDTAESEFAGICEKYLLSQLERGFATLDFYKELTIT